MHIMSKQKRNEKILKEMLIKKWMIFDPKKEMQERANQIRSRLETAKNNPFLHPFPVY